LVISIACVASCALGIAAGAAVAPIASLVPVAGDRQIVVAPNPSSTAVPSPYVVRALDASGNPVGGAQLFVGPATDIGQAYVQDEFHFTGFHIFSPLCYTCFGSVSPANLANTGADGLATWSGSYVYSAPAAFLIGTRAVSEPSAAQAFWSVVLVKAPPPGRPAVVVEYFNARTGHYFITLDANEIALLDAGRFDGWKRSIGAFVAYASAADAPAGAVPVCRFFHAKYTSHFYTADPDECNTVIRTWPDEWILETRTAFFIFVPDKATGACAPGLQPIYRLYDNKPIPNHRYIADRMLRDHMTGAGWLAEGYGPDAAMLCTAE
jgi:hypothetical protein